MKLGIEYWNKKWDKPLDTDVAAISDAFSSSGVFTNEDKVKFAEILLQGRYRSAVSDDDEGGYISELCWKFNANYAVEELIYSESEYVLMLWRYDFAQIFKAIPLQIAKQALRNIYSRLGMTIEDKDISRIFRQDFVYQALFDLIAENLGDNKYVFCDDPALWHTFAFGAWFNMWKFFDVMGFNGYSPYTICGDIGILCPKACDWKFVALPKGSLEAVKELNNLARGRDFPTWKQNAFLGKLAKI
jgi:hypothetical protein